MPGAVWGSKDWVSPTRRYFIVADRQIKPTTIHATMWTNQIKGDFFPVSEDSLRWYTLVLMLMQPLYIPMARYWPSLVQEQHVTLLGILCLDTDFCSIDHRPDFFLIRKKLINPLTPRRGTAFKLHGKDGIINMFWYSQRVHWNFNTHTELGCFSFFFHVGCK